MPVEGWDVPTFSQPVVHQRYPLSKAISGDRWSIYFQEQMPFLISNHQLSKHQSWRHKISASSSRMRVMNHNWSATKQRLHLQNVAEISRHSVLSWDRIRQCGTLSGSRHKDTDQCPQVTISFCRHCSVPVPCENNSALLPREVQTRVPDCEVTH